MDIAYTEQTDVDRAFADYDSARLTVNPRPAYASRDAMLCVNCDSHIHTYNNSGSRDAGARVCNHCGLVQSGNIIFEQMFGAKLTNRTSNYKRIHHWHERISQLMLMESQIPTEHMLSIGERLLDGSHATMSKDTVRTVLRSLGLQVYIEKWLQIIERCTGILPPCPGPVVLERMDALFTELQRPFRAHKLASRRNFLNYNYVFCRLFQLMGCTKFCMFFPLIRSKAKLNALDDMWRPMASSLGWKVPPLQQVTPFSVRVVKPAALLQTLKDRCASLKPVEPRIMPKRMEVRMWDRRPSLLYLPVREPRRLIPSEQRPQTLSLRLKRKRNAAA